MLKMNLSRFSRLSPGKTYSETPKYLHTRIPLPMTLYTGLFLFVHSQGLRSQNVSVQGGKGDVLFTSHCGE